MRGKCSLHAECAYQICDLDLKSDHPSHKSNYATGFGASRLLITVRYATITIITTQVRIGCCPWRVKPNLGPSKSLGEINCESGLGSQLSAMLSPPSHLAVSLFGHMAHSKLPLGEAAKSIFVYLDTRTRASTSNCSAFLPLARICKVVPS